MNKLITVDEVIAEYKPFGRKAIRALNAASLSLNSYEILGLFGLNGAGKTTLIRLILGMMQASNGKVDVLGLNPISNREIILANLGVILEGERFFEARLKADDILQLVGASYGLRPSEIKKRADELFYKFGLEPNRFKLITEYSRGMRQKLSLILAILHQPKILILDEPIIALDIETSREFMMMIKEIADSGCGVIISSHQINTIAKLIDKAVILKDGKTIFEANANSLIERFGKPRFRVKFENKVDISSLPKGVDFANDSFVVETDTEISAKFFSWAKREGLVLDGLEPIQDLESAFMKINNERALL